MLVGFEPQVHLRGVEKAAGKLPGLHSASPPQVVELHWVVPPPRGNACPLSPQVVDLNSAFPFSLPSVVELPRYWVFEVCPRTRGGPSLSMMPPSLPSSQVVELQKYWVFEACSHGTKESILRECCAVLEKALSTIHDKAEVTGGEEGTKG